MYRLRCHQGLKKRVLDNIKAAQELILVKLFKEIVELIYSYRDLQKRKKSVICRATETVESEGEI